ncbi:uncharacterized protein LOC109543554 isoform X1 [Dendroctonus ponderosae]|uniref:uncharacterized protein LOC109543554 isoform X1 n=1 Tax=Dendroctonus ponderosae TaxID=77166 RepID=UPI0020351B98|nr:uncharacterized protein LOC109543554 isoform X1 [Dendroctonus ponderosae]XP_048518430.1 uncharacterized protein LOC109543554 isoform X1 [Dendroctonus ponderosae]KAH1004517.1 hypothetical protein HUJ05_005316 [Dendroctonus ponderosae]
MVSIRVQLALVLLSSIAECRLAQEFSSRLQSFPIGAGSTKPNLRAALQRLIHNKPLPHPDVLANNGEASESSESSEVGPGASDSTAYSLRSALLPNAVDSREPSEAHESTVQDGMKESAADNITEEVDDSESAATSVSTPASKSEETKPFEAAARTTSLDDTNVPEEAPENKIGAEGKTRSGPAPASGVEVGQEKALNFRNEKVVCGSPAGSSEGPESEIPGNLAPDDRFGATERSGQSASQLRGLWEGRNPGEYVGNTFGSQRNYFDHLMPYNPYFPGYQSPQWPNLVYPQFAPGCSRALDTAGFGGHPSDPSQIYYPHVYPYPSYPLVYPYHNGRTSSE